MRRESPIVGVHFVTLDDTLLEAFIIFCRIGACVMTLPGFSSSHIPVRVRLYIAIAITLTLAPMLWTSIASTIVGAPFWKILLLIIGELLIGALIGLSARLFFFALETLATSVAMTIGLGNLLGSGVADVDASPALASFIVLCATVLIFTTDQHLQIIEGLFLSYRAMPIADAPETNSMAKYFLQTLEHSFLLALRISSPFLLFGLVTNFAFGLLNRLTPQIPVYFISTPFLIALGLYLFYEISRDFFVGFSSEFGSWLLTG
jgi:flagellar biosynthetic protein FliR